jgi:hypothetical protein
MTVSTNGIFHMQSGLRNGSDRIAEAHDQGVAGLRHREQRKEGDEDRGEGEQRDDAPDIEFHAPSTDGGGTEFVFVSPEPLECRHFFVSVIAISTSSRGRWFVFRD